MEIRSIAGSDHRKANDTYTLTCTLAHMKKRERIDTRREASAWRTRCVKQCENYGLPKHAHTHTYSQWTTQSRSTTATTKTTPRTGRPFASAQQTVAAFPTIPKGSFRTRDRFDLIRFDTAPSPVDNPTTEQQGRSIPTHTPINDAVNNLTVRNKRIHQQTGGKEGRKEGRKEVASVAVVECDVGRRF